MLFPTFKHFRILNIAALVGVCNHGMAITMAEPHRVMISWPAITRMAESMHAERTASPLKCTWCERRRGYLNSGP